MATCGLGPHGREDSIGSTRSDQARGCSISRRVDQPAPIEVQADEVVAEHSPLHHHMTLAHWHTEVYHWHTCATEVCQTKSSRSGLKVTAHRVSARSEEVAKSWHTGTPKSHQPCFTADHVGAEVSVRACGAHSVCGSSFFFSKKKRYRCASVPARR